MEFSKKDDKKDKKDFEKLSHQILSISKHKKPEVILCALTTCYAIVVEDNIREEDFEKVIKVAAESITKKLKLIKSCKSAHPVTVKA